jgi:hypothetical protein
VENDSNTEISPRLKILSEGWSRVIRVLSTTLSADYNCLFLLAVIDTDK